MLKKLFKIGMLASVLTLSLNAFAQDGISDFPRTSFWSNWSLGGDVDVCREAHYDKLGLGVNIMAQRQLNYNWALRLTVGSPVIPKINNGVDGFGVTTVGFNYSILNACQPNAERKADLYLFLDGGMSWFLDRPNYGMNALYADGGLGFSYKVCEKSSIFAEATVGINADVPAPKRPFGKDAQVVGYIGLGYMYHFGLTAADKEALAQKAMLTQENYDAMSAQVNELTNEVAASKQAEKKLSDRVNTLEQQLAKAPKGSGADADSLRNVIKQMKDDQLTYYAMPFSILYATDQWKVPADQKDKVKAIARVLKDNPSVKITIAGFCDYTGSDAYNDKLSQKRAEEVKRILVNEYGISEDRLTCDAHGKRLAFGDLNYSINRRTSFYRVIE